MLLILVIYSFLLPVEHFAAKNGEINEVDPIDSAVISTDEEQGAALFVTDEDEPVSYIGDGQEVFILEEGDLFSTVQYEGQDNQVFKGYVKNEYLEKPDPENADDKGETEANTDSPTGTDFDKNEEEPLTLSASDDMQGIALKDRTNVYETDSRQSSELKDYAQGSILNYEHYNNNWYQAVVIIKGTRTQGFIHHTDVENAGVEQENLHGIATAAPTAVYQSASKNAEQWKTYQAGSPLTYKTFSKDWYQASVIVKGKRVTGYIHKNDTETKQGSQEDLRGLALNAKTPVYQQAHTSSEKLKTYQAGSVLQYKTLTKNWYQASVILHGKRVSGFIHKKDVEQTVSKQVHKRGINLQKVTVYDKASQNGKKLKSYPKGSELQYKTLTDDWHEVTVYIKGKKKTGFIEAKGLEQTSENQKGLRGIGLKKSTPVYQRATTDSKHLKTYPQGAILQYKTLSKNWYAAEVIIKGKRQNGYIHASDVENATEEQKSLQGVAFKEKGVKVYSRASTASKALKKYQYSSILKYKSFTKNWYAAEVILDGKRKKAYLKKSDVKALDYQLEGFGQKNPTHIYLEPSRKSKTIKTYHRGSKLKYKAYSKNWHSARVKVNGKYQRGYLAAKDVHFEMKDLINKTTYPYDFKEMTDRQVKKKPNQDGAGTIQSTRGEIEFFTTPANFPASSDEYFQFLVLSEPAGLDAKQINERILKGKGSLEGMAQAFINAGKKYSVNEAYLIAHALHETGNGKSTLAQGIPVDKNGKVTRNKSGKIINTSKTKHTVYNMFGYGAKNSCPIDCGAQYAFDHGWFTIEDSIIGGIESIHSYIKRGQDTLYKMRWNPDGGLTPPKIPEWYQYATHTEWAVIQTKRIAEIYSLMDEYVVEMDIPKFQNTPSVGKTTPKSLQIKTGPSKTNKSIGVIPKHAQIKINDSNPNAWYKVTYKGKTGWIEAKYVNLIY